MKYSITKSTKTLVVTLDTESGKYSPRITTFNDPSVILGNNDICLLENGEPLMYLQSHEIGLIDGVEAVSLVDAVSRLNIIISTLSIVNINTKVEKYTLEASLPTIGSLLSIYFLTIDGVKYLKYWNGYAYVNASEKIILPNAVSDFLRDYYAVKSDINLANYNGKCAQIAVIEDEENTNTFTHYFYNGSELQWIVSVNQ